MFITKIYNTINQCGIIFALPRQELYMQSILIENIALALHGKNATISTKTGEKIIQLPHTKRWDQTIRCAGRKSCSSFQFRSRLSGSKQTPMPYKTAPLLRYHSASL